MTSVRVYVGGLPSDAKKQELRERFGRFVRDAAACELQDVELPKPKPMGGVPPPPGASRGFAYLTLRGADAQAQSEKLQKTFNRTKWRGSLLKVQVARPHYQEKLQQEWDEALQKGEHQDQIKSVETLQPMNVAVTFTGRRKTTFEEVEQVQVQEQETDSETSEEEEEQENEEEVEQALGEDDVEAFVRQMEMEESEEKQGKKELSKEEMNARRLAALEAKQQRKKEKGVIPAVGEATANKKITFDDSGNEQEPEEQEEEDGNAVVSNWMDSSDEEAEAEEGSRGARKTFDFTGDDEDAAADAEAQAAFALRPEFVGEKGKKLFEMQKRFGGDSRFRLDARFLEEEANEYGGNDVEDEGDKEINGEAVAELQNFLEEEDSVEAARHVREMREEEEAALRVVSKLYPDVDVTRLQRLMQDQRAPKDPLKEAAWMGELKRYDPRDAHACREFEIPMTAAVSGVQKEDEVAAAPKREEKEIPTGGDRFFATTGDLSNLFSRVRKNSEDGEEGEAALDGVFGSASASTNDDAPFKMSSLFSFPVGEDKPLAALGEQLLEDEQQEPSAAEWTFSQGFHPTDDHDEAMATDSEAGDDEAEDDEERKSQLTKKRAKKSLEDFLAFGRTFVGGDEVQDWPERRKKLTLDYKRKRRDAAKMKKRQNKQQNKANKAKTDPNAPSKWKKARL